MASRIFFKTSGLYFFRSCRYWLSGKFTVMDCRDIASIKGSFHGIIAGFCLPYLSKSEAAKFFRDCYRLLEPEGIFYVSTIEGNYSQSGFATASTGDQCFVYYYAEDYIRTLLIKTGFEVTDLIRKKVPRKDGTISEELIFIARK